MRTFLLEFAVGFAIGLSVLVVLFTAAAVAFWIF